VSAGLSVEPKGVYVLSKAMYIRFAFILVLKL